MAEKKHHMSIVAPSKDWLIQVGRYAKRAGVSRSKYVVGVLTAAMAHADARDEDTPIDAPEAELMERMAVEGANLDDLVQESAKHQDMRQLLDGVIIKALERNPKELADNLDPKMVLDFAQRRVGKMSQVDEDAQKSALSLRDSLAHLPEVRDLDHELRVKERTVRVLRAERDTLQYQLRLLKGISKYFKNELDFPGLRALWKEQMERIVRAVFRLKEEDNATLPEYTIEAFKVPLDVWQHSERSLLGGKIEVPGEEIEE